eukprot:CAMPEP_0181446094 /NCGR_PEP_ID=MMETSP1110-20121109/25928_1 /TAXON_ID=174948 /ORGANISM="Symbiodinium sp., Strain CCMP421" /LENGTH=61 /DNA_ID=CAMNT_0023570163 /DNA_START=837 /DNA_END=1019 /DNA_ORIENTATION=+
MAVHVALALVTVLALVDVLALVGLMGQLLPVGDDLQEVGQIFLCLAGLRANRMKYFGTGCE